jgi:hypothetical protein
MHTHAYSYILTHAHTYLGGVIHTFPHKKQHVIISEIQIKSSGDYIPIFIRECFCIPIKRKKTIQYIIKHLKHLTDGKEDGFALLRLLSFVPLSIRYTMINIFTSIQWRPNTISKKRGNTCKAVRAGNNLILLLCQEKSKHGLEKTI